MPSFRPKNSKNILVDKRTTTTLDGKHNEYLNKFLSDEKTILPIDKVEPIEIEKSETIELLDQTIKNDFVTEEITIKSTNKVDNFLEPHKSKSKKNYNILSSIIVFIVSFIALIIILDTFQDPISNIVPNIEFLLYSLYETIYDVLLFFRDLI